VFRLHSQTVTWSNAFVFGRVDCRGSRWVQWWLVQSTRTVKFRKLFSLRGPPFVFEKMTTNPHVLAHINTECTDDKYPKLYICILKLILDSCQYIPLAYVTMHCMIWY